MKRSLRVVVAIAGNTLTEALRQRTLNVVILFSLVMLAGSDFFTQFSFQEEFKFLKDLAYAVISIGGLLVALMGAAQLIPAEIERRTLYTTLSKPVHRFEFILGKYLGLLALLTLMTALFSVVFAGVLWHQERTTLEEYGLVPGTPMSEEEQRLLEQVLAQSRDPAMVQAILLVWCKLAVTAAISVAFSTIATSTIFIVSTTLMVYFAGHLQAVARQMWLYEAGHPSWWKQAALAAIAWLVPDFQAYNLIDEIIVGNAVFWADTLGIAGYSVVYAAVVLVAAGLAFQDREL
jgi:ABC-type transport system involved in multi-copper enzyme maturation permease subunit